MTCNISNPLRYLVLLPFSPTPDRECPPPERGLISALHVGDKGAKSLNFRNKRSSNTKVAKVPKEIYLICSGIFT